MPKATLAQRARRFRFRKKLAGYFDVPVTDDDCRAILGAIVSGDFEALPPNLQKITPRETLRALQLLLEYSATRPADTIDAPAVRVVFDEPPPLPDVKHGSASPDATPEAS